MLKSLWQQVVKVTAPSQSHWWKWTRTVCFSCRIRNYVASLNSFEQVDTNRAHDVWILIFFRSNLRLLGIISFSGRSLQKWLYQWNWLQDAEGAGRQGGIGSQDWEGGEGGLGLIGTFTAVCDSVCLFGCWQVQFFCRGVVNPMIGTNLAVMQQSTLVCLQAATSAELLCVASPSYPFVHVAQSKTSLQQLLLITTPPTARLSQHQPVCWTATWHSPANLQQFHQRHVCLIVQCQHSTAAGWAATCACCCCTNTALDTVIAGQYTRCTASVNPSL